MAKEDEAEAAPVAAPGWSMGPSVDSAGASVVDPTKNVLDLTKAEGKYQDGMRESQEKLQTAALDWTNKFQNFARESESRLHTALREAESKRTDQIREQGDRFQTVIANMLAKSVESTSTLVSTQLVQIQATFDARVSKLEEFRWSSAGRSSVADPALAETLAKLASAVNGLKGTEDKSTGQSMGQDKLIAYAIAAVMAAIAAGMLVTNLIGH